MLIHGTDEGNKLWSELTQVEPPGIIEELIFFNVKVVNGVVPQPANVTGALQALKARDGVKLEGGRAPGGCCEAQRKKACCCAEVVVVVVV